MRRKPAFCVIIVFALAMFANSAGAQQKSQPADYTLDENPLGIAIYPGLEYRSGLGPKDRMSTMKEVEDRVARLPAGTKLHWTPYKRDRAGKPMLFSSTEKYDKFAKFCGDHRVELMVAPLDAGRG